MQNDQNPDTNPAGGTSTTNEPAPLTPPAGAAYPNSTFGSGSTNTGKSSKKMLVVITVIVLLLLAIGAVLMLGGGANARQDAEKRADEVVALLKASKDDKTKLNDILYQDLGFSQDETDTTKINEIIAISSAAGLAANAMELTEAGETFENETLTRTYNAKFSDDQEITITVEMKVTKDNGKWELSSLTDNLPDN